MQDTVTQRARRTLGQDAFTIDLHAATVTCPAGQRAPLTVIADGQIARFGKACLGCPLAARCTTAPGGRTIHVGPTRPR